MAAIDNFRFVGNTLLEPAVPGHVQATLDCLKPYVFHRSSNISFPAKLPHLYVVGEQHDERESMGFAADLVNTLAAQGPVVVLHENVESGVVINNEKNEKANLLRYRGFDHRLEHNISVVGFDLPDEAFNVIGTPDHEITFIQRRLMGLCLYKSTLVDKIKKIAPLFINENIVDASSVLSISSLFHMDRMVEVLLPLPMEQCQEVADLFKKVKEVIAETLHVLQAIVKIKPLNREAVRDLFPSRTRAFCMTVQQLSEIKRKLGLPDDTPVVGIMGAEHVMTPLLKRDDPNYDLTLSDQELDNHRALSLMPRHIWEMFTDPFLNS